MEAVDLVSPGINTSYHYQTWADLGCGAGAFTLALAECIGPGLIHAVDADITRLSLLPERVGQVTIRAIEADFTQVNLPKGLDGLIMANSLHYVKDQHQLLNNLMVLLKPAGRIILVEYDSESANQWVPFPVSYRAAKQLFNGLGLELQRLGTKPSIFQTEMIYSAVATKAL